MSENPEHPGIPIQSALDDIWKALWGSAGDPLRGPLPFSPDLRDHLDDILYELWNGGYRHGYDVGYDRGYDSGQESGYNSGYDTGYDTGKWTASDE